MAELSVALFDGGLQTPVRLELSGGPPAAPYLGAPPQPFSIDWIDAGGEIPLHFNPRPDEGRIVLNSYLLGAWGEELVIDDYPLPAEPDRPFRLRFDVTAEGFDVFVGGTHLCEFPHRARPSAITEVRSTAFLWRLEAPDGLGPRLRRKGGRAIQPLTVPALRGQPSGRNWRVGWIASEENPSAPNTLEAFSLFAVVCAWMEEDVIEATVANCLRQGCERVYLVDNGSSDRTVERARRAGAQIAATFDDGYFIDPEKTRHLQAVVDEVSQAEGDQPIWWLFLDADEFYHGPGGMTLREYLARLDRRFRIVGARFFNHLPDRAPAYVEGRHPLDFQPLCYEIAAPYCELGHWRHSLQRWDFGSSRIACGKAFHDADCSDLLLEPAVPVVFHHFPYRTEEVSRLRLERLFGRADGTKARVVDERAQAHMRLRLRSFDAVYRRQWEKMDFYPTCAAGYVPELRRWEDWVEPADRFVARWY